MIKKNSKIEKCYKTAINTLFSFKKNLFVNIIMKLDSLCKIKLICLNII
jgi:hypothetical protein